MSTEVLPEYEGVFDKRQLRHIGRSRRRCKLVGHIWYLESFTPPHIYRLMCDRCFPHIQSRRTVETYNLFSQPKKDRT